MLRGAPVLLRRSNSLRNPGEMKILIFFKAGLRKQSDCMAMVIHRSGIFFFECAFAPSVYETLSSNVNDNVYSIIGNPST